MSGNDQKPDNARQAALDYHEFPKPGKLEIRATKPMTTGRDLSRAYSPGVADACLEIEKNAADAFRYTAKGNLVAVISNGTAVLGLGNIGAAASKPVMEGKAVLFKKFANIDCFDIEVNEPDPVKLAELVIRLEPTFGAINLEDIKAPDCFLVEKMCKEAMNIPVFHDDQHGTAIVAAAAAFNALIVAKKKIEDIRVVALGAGAAGIACLWGPAHGGANQACLEMLKEIGTPDRIPEFIARAKDKNDPFRLMGFGHRVYRNFDPRAKVMKQTCDEVLAELNISDPLLKIAKRLEQIALEDEYFVKRKLYPNVDFYSGIILKAIGIPTNMFTVIFALSRTIGWISHWSEFHSSPNKIGRPRQLYTGPSKRDYPE